MTLTYALENWINFADDGNHRALDVGGITITAFHRLSFAKDKPRDYPDVTPIPDRELTAQAVAERFADKREYRAGAYTGGQMPYGLLVLPSGIMQQALPFSEYGPHARRWSFKAFALAVIGDFTKHAPTAEQWLSCIEIGALLQACGCAPRGHTELEGASRDASKQCPGGFFDMLALRAEIETHPNVKLAAHHAMLVLTQHGFVF